MESRDESRATDCRVAVHDSLLHVALDGGEHGSVGDAAESADSRRSVAVLVARHVLGERRGDDDDVVGKSAQLLFVF